MLQWAGSIARKCNGQSPPPADRRTHHRTRQARVPQPAVRAPATITASLWAAPLFYPIIIERGSGWHDSALLHNSPPRAARIFAIPAIYNEVGRTEPRRKTVEQKGADLYPCIDFGKNRLKNFLPVQRHPHQRASTSPAHRELLILAACGGGVSPQLPAPPAPTQSASGS